MTSELLLDGYHCPDCNNIIYYVHLQAQSWRIKQDRCLVSFVAYLEPGEGQTFVLDCILPIGIFGNTYSPYCFIALPNNSALECEWDHGTLIVKCKQFVVCGAFTLMAYENRDATRYTLVYTHTGQPVSLEDLRDSRSHVLQYGVVRDPCNNVVGLALRESILYDTCKDYIPMDFVEVFNTLKDCWEKRTLLQKGESVKPYPIKTKYEVSGVLLVKDENEYLDEWFDENVKIGFQHFYVYDNSDDNSVYIPTRYKDMTTVIPFQAVRHLQYECYQHFLCHYGQETRWVSCFDADEIWTGPLLDTLKELEGDIVLLYVRWSLHGADGQVKWKEGTQFERFPTIIQPMSWPFGKTFVQPACVQTLYTHNATIHPSYLQYYPDGNDIYEKCGMMDNISTYKLKCHHFITRSLEEYYYKKILRGSCDNGYLRKMSEFLQYNPDMKEEYKQFCLEKGIGDLEMPRHKVV